MFPKGVYPTEVESDAACTCRPALLNFLKRTAVSFWCTVLYGKKNPAGKFQEKSKKWACAAREARGARPFFGFSGFFGSFRILFQYNVFCFHLFCICFPCSGFTFLLTCTKLFQNGCRQFSLQFSLKHCVRAAYWQSYARVTSTKYYDPTLQGGKSASQGLQH